MENVLITICGRAGSKGFKNKNLKIFDGLPLSHYSLAAAELFIGQHPELHVDLCLNAEFFQNFCGGLYHLKIRLAAH